jgi:Uma2 family endonuclease
MASLKHHRFTVEQYHNMAEAGAFQPDDRVELIHGEIVDMTPIGIKHSRIVDQLIRYLNRAPQKDPIARAQNPIVLGNHSEPQPDLTVVRYRSDFYDKALPTAADVLLLIEVSDSSLSADRQVKLPLYAQAMIPEVWIVNLAEKSIERYTAPSAGEYTNAQIFKAPQSLTPAVFPGHVLSLAELFPE